MEKNMNEKGMKEIWTNIFTTDKYSTKIRELTFDQNALVIELKDIANESPDLAEKLLEQPLNILNSAEQVLKEEIRSRSLQEKIINPKIRIIDLYQHNHIEISNLRSKHLGKLIAIEGKIKRKTETKSQVKLAVWECTCGHQQRTVQVGDKMQKPFNCPDCEGGCGRKGNSLQVNLIGSKTRFVDYQEIEIQEQYISTSQPQTLQCKMIGTLCGQIECGDDVILVGILSYEPMKRNSNIMNMYLKVNSITQTEITKNQMEIIDKEKELIEFSKNNPIEKLINSLAPSLSGMEEIKKAMLLLAVGGVEKTFRDNTKARGNIHILLIGDPGTGKSKLLRYFADLMPGAINVSGQGASSAGLTFAAVQDDFGEGGWALEAGALVLAHGGYCCIDEFSDMSPKDRRSIKEPMALGILQADKANIHATLHCSCPILAAANPKQGRFGIYEDILDAINLPPPIFSRFDIIFPIKDRQDDEKDERISRHVLNAHRENQTTTTSEHLSLEFIRKYLLYARQLKPTLTKEQVDYLTKVYLKIRKQSTEGETTITIRQLEAIIRLSEAAAKLRLSKEVEKQDTDLALNLIKSYISEISGDKMNFDRIEAGTKKSQRAKMKMILKVMQDGYHKKRQIIDYMDERHIASVETDKLLDKMKTQGIIYEKANDTFYSVS